MGLFTGLYDRSLGWARHPRASWYLGGMSFAESTFFPIPPDVLLIPMMLARPKRAWHYALICTVSSVLGGLLGYALGRFGFELIEGWLMGSAYAGAFESANLAFERYGFWFILVAGFSPIPYKVFTISAGVIGMPFLPFVLGSATGRGGRFFLEALIISLGGESAAEKLRGWIDWIGWGMVLLVVVLLCYYFFARGGG